MVSFTSPASSTQTPQAYVQAQSLVYYWDVATLTWLEGTQPGGGSGGAVTLADGADVAQGTKADAAWVSGSGTVISLLKTIAGISPGGGLTDAQLRASAVPVSGTVAVTSAGLTNLDVALSTRLKPADTLAGITTVAAVTSITNPVAVTGPLTDTQLRATPVPVSGTVTASGPLTDTQLRNSAVPVSVSGVATAANQTTELASLSSIDGKTPALGQALAGSSSPVVLTAAQLTTLTPPAAITGYALETTQQLQATAALQTLGNASLTTIAALSKAEDAPSADGDTGIPALLVREDSPATLVGLLGDYHWFTGDSQGRLWVNSDVLGEHLKRSTDLQLTQARLLTDQFRFSSQMAGAFIPVPEVY